MAWIRPNVTIQMKNKGVKGFSMKKNSHRVILFQMCLRCGLAARMCPVGAIKQDLWGRFYISKECIGCDQCVRVCPARAVV
jgi:NAD-dependent dihydropyrimidine dehydrogenase PreA subunit